MVFDGSRPLTSGTTVAHPLQVGARDAGRPEAEFDLMQQMLPYLLLLGFIGGMQVAIDATADERGRQSLDPLLATPAPREAIISATALTALAAFARSYREAQGYRPLLVLRPMLPSLVLICFGMTGGTGSGMLIDMGYLARHLLAERASAGGLALYTGAMPHSGRARSSWRCAARTRATPKSAGWGIGIRG